MGGDAHAIGRDRARPCLRRAPAGGVRRLALLTTWEKPDGGVRLVDGRYRVLALRRARPRPVPRGDRRRLPRGVVRRPGDRLPPARARRPDGEPAWGGRGALGLPGRRARAGRVLALRR